jgi:hypothetical protein
MANSLIDKSTLLQPLPALTTKDIYPCFATIYILTVTLQVHVPSSEDCLSLAEDLADLTTTSVDMFIAILMETDHILVYTQTYKEDSTYIVAPTFYTPDQTPSSILSQRPSKCSKSLQKRVPILSAPASKTRRMI